MILCLTRVAHLTVVCRAHVAFLRLGWHRGSSITRHCTFGCNRSRHEWDPTGEELNATKDGLKRGKEGDQCRLIFVSEAVSFEFSVTYILTWSNIPGARFTKRTITTLKRDHDGCAVKAKGT